ncbi:uncharacterized protein A1O9_04460 [Exophiala aquamarina CBS 119918]|uniref:DUF1446 domain-containing protein n=1 Tax=Exophiala aquamarina CBS 119918 TaxID=1182545 RepID=A0A072PHJ4_9EURO|nr:uncharacterized protein A1O9_04460 [Exophiala aquamarina CBS 119918]KEF59614.1 hypothetical protein A1O9_04460 [Exophiala aquamarina CBS 119918]
MSQGVIDKGKRPILVGSVSGSTGDRLDGLKSMLRGDIIIDAIIGDWLSEVNLASRSLQLRAGKKGGYEPGFLYSLREGLDDYLNYQNQNVRIAVNAGGLNPKGLAEEVQNLLCSRGSEKRVAYVVGDNLLSQLENLDIQPLTRATGNFQNWKRKYPEIILANAYIGCWGIVRALAEGADIVICGRCTDASTVMGVTAWWHGWSQGEFDKLAGSLMAGHLIECGCYVTGGNFGGFQNLNPRYYDLSYPIAAIAADGTSVIQKHANQNGIVTTDTVRGQFLYEIQGSFYYNPDVIADITRINFDQVGKDSVQVSGVRGLPAPETLKIAIMAIGGYQAEFSLYVTGLDTKEKAASFELMSRRMVDESQFEILEFQLYGSPKGNPRNQLESTLQLRIFAQAKDPKAVAPGRFLGPLMSNQLSGYPGLTANFDFRTADPKLFCTYFPGLVNQKHVQQVVHFATMEDSAPGILAPRATAYTPVDLLPIQPDYQPTNPVALPSFGATVRAPLGLAVYARSGDKGANVNVGFFFPRGPHESAKYEWLRNFLTTSTLRELLADEATSDTYIERCEFPNIRAVHFVIHGILGAGVSSSVKMDSLGKNVAEYLRARHVDIPQKFLEKKAVL